MNLIELLVAHHRGQIPETRVFEFRAPPTDWIPQYQAGVAATFRKVQLEAPHLANDLEPVRLLETSDGWEDCRPERGAGVNVYCFRKTTESLVLVHFPWILADGGDRAKVFALLAYDGFSEVIDRVAGHEVAPLGDTELDVLTVGGTPVSPQEFVSLVAAG